MFFSPARRTLPPPLLADTRGQVPGTDSESQAPWGTLYRPLWQLGGFGGRTDKGGAGGGERGNGGRVTGRGVRELSRVGRYLDYPVLDLAELPLATVTVLCVGGC